MVKRRGPRPNPAPLRLVSGTHRTDRHGDIGEAEKRIEKASASFGDIEMPAHFTGEAKAAWERYVQPCWWLDASREVTAIVFCELWQELRSNPADFPATKHVQLRSYMHELGLTDERNRFGTGRRSTGDEFFD